MSSFLKTPPPRDTSWTSLQSWSDSADEFNKKIAPIVKTAQTVYAVGSLVTGNVAPAISTLMDKGRFFNAKRNIQSLEGFRNTLVNSPDKFTEVEHGQSMKLLDSLQAFSNAYEGTESSIPAESLDRIKEFHSGYSNLFNPETINKTRQDLIKNKDEADIQNMLESVSSNASLSDISPYTYPEISDQVGGFFRNNLNNIKNKIYPSFGYNMVNDVNNTVKDYSFSMAENSKSGISNGIKSINKMNKIAIEYPTTENLTILGKMKYDFAVRSRKWVQ